jgi:PAS domain S-box-containing protein
MNDAFPADSYALLPDVSASGTRTSSPQLFEQLFELAGVGLLQMSLDGRVLLANPAAAKFLDRSRADLLGRSVLDFTHPDDVPGTLATITQVVSATTDVAVLEKRYLHPNGRVVWSRSRVSLLADTLNAPSLIAVIADITELKLTQFALQAANDHLVATTEGSMLGLGVALEARDLETGGHTERVVKLSARLGRDLGLNDAALSELRQGAYLHDLGKLSVPDAVLLKPGRLDPDERALMQTHATHGHAIARRIPTLTSGALDVIRHHHERWDGAGYPDGLAGEEIPLLARIFAVCDVYDALTSERPYKRAWSDEDAVAELTAQRGRHFDARVVDRFTACRHEDPLLK